MARYDYDWSFGQSPRTRKDIRGSRPGGLDPNYRGGSYRGERLHADHIGDAPYGWHRRRHAEQMPGAPEPHRGRGPRDTGYDLGYPRSGQVQRYGYDREYLRDFNRNSPAFRSGRRSGRGGYDRMTRARSGPDPSRPLRYDAGFNRYGGYSSGGFSEQGIPRQSTR